MKANIVFKFFSEILKTFTSILNAFEGFTDTILSAFLTTMDILLNGTTKFVPQYTINAESPFNRTQKMSVVGSIHLSAITKF